MIGNNEFLKINNNDVINRNTLGRHEVWGVGEIINVDAELVAGQEWHEMLDLTQKDELERGVVVSWNGKSISTSKIITGSKDSFSPPFLPHGFRSLLPATRNLVYIHTHFMPPKLDHVKTTAVSDKDINSFINLSCKAMLMIDRGGVHMLTRKINDFTIDKSEVPIKVVDEALGKAKSGGNTSIDLVREIATSLAPLGVKYYYSQSLIPSTEGFITLKDAMKL